MPKGHMVQSSDERYRSLLNVIKKGYIKRYSITNDGSLAVQAVYGPGDIFPLTLVFKSLVNQEVYQGPEIIYYQTMTNAEIYSIDVESLVEVSAKEPAIYRDLLTEAGVRTNSNIQRLENLSLKSSYRRTAHQLAYYAHQFGEKKNGNIRINLPLTHQDLADILSLTRETVSLNLHKLQQENLIKNGRNIVVVDLDKLEAEAYGHRKKISPKAIEAEADLTNRQ